MKRSFIFILTAILITLSVLPICSAESVDATLKAAYNYDKDANIIKVEARFFDIKVEEGIITANYDIKYDPEALELVEFKTVFPEEWDKFLSDESVKDFSVKKEDGHISWVFVVVPVGQGAKNDNVLIRSLVKQKCGLCHQGVEPASGLVNCFGNELCRELLFK